MKRIMLLLAVSALLVLAMAVPVFAAPNPNSAAGQCRPPGQIINLFTPNPEQQLGIAPGQSVLSFCVPVHQ